ncbi:hypothetical protein CPL00168_CDS0066 [Escherichia phage MatMar]
MPSRLVLVASANRSCLFCSRVFAFQGGMFPRCFSMYCERKKQNKSLIIH